MKTLRAARVQFYWFLYKKECILRMSILVLTYMEKHKCPTQYNLIGIAEKFRSVYYLAVRNSLTTASFTSRKYLLTINLCNTDLCFPVMKYIYRCFIHFIH